MAALVRHWSTVVNGSQQEVAAFRKEADRMLRFDAEMAAGAK